MPWKDPQKRREYQRQWKRRRYEEARRALGGVCSRCGKTHDLEIDHVYRSTKEYRITDVVSRRAEIRLAELAKCQLLCVDDHSWKTSFDETEDTIPF
jgi:5-methylcytosine-specific restriction endonuclease McrA